LKSVFHVITTINRGGAENQLLVLAREQIEIGLDVHIVYLKGEPELEFEFSRMGAKVHHDLSLKHPFFQPVALWKLIGKSKPVVHAHLPRAELVSLLCPAKFKLVASRHNSEPFFPGAPKSISNFLSRLVEMRSIQVIAISEAVREFLVNRGEVRNTNSIEVVLYGYRTHFSRSVRTNQKRTLVRRLGTISRLADQKDIPTMLDAFKNFRDSHPEATLSILGAGPLEENLKELVSQINLENSVIFAGRSSKVYEFLLNLDVFILTSKYEGFGMVLLEAMDSGVPILASNNSAIPEVLGRDFSGLCITGNSFDFASKLERLFDPNFRQSILDQQEARLKLFDSKLMCEKISVIYSL
jgi:glycosyltransferase involved in cell wall biosynthesis